MGGRTFERKAPFATTSCKKGGWAYFREVTVVLVTFPASVQQRKALKTQPRCTQQPDYAAPRLPEIYIPEAPELGTPRYDDKMLGPVVSVIEGFHCILVAIQPTTQPTFMLRHSQNVAIM